MLKTFEFVRVDARMKFYFVPAEQVQSSESIYGTRGDPVAAGPWGVSTQRGSTVYVHVLDWNQPVLALGGMPRAVRSAKLMRDGSSVELSVVKNGLVLILPEALADEVDRIVVLELEPAK
jgi:alpha-L-fucosidase